MGDSISEGAISAILKEEGASVKMDDVIVQIETDKVTIDVKSTEDGVIQRLLVKSGAIVKPGQVVASVSKVGAPSTGPKTDSPSTSAPVVPSAPAVGAVSALSHTKPSHQAGRIPGIHFPTRRTSSGERISDLPASQQEQLSGNKQHAATPPAPQHATADAVPPIPVTVPAAPTNVSSKVVVTTVLKETPPRRALTAREVELINGGGAW
ncbi:hypothetical protein CEUSTIGMA_g7128.t1 [Chlamydomonas eustigma]|uniref:Lipoyl-binding domain-containing protein n=1 Tax=Chlamydomonas eustigma TaxID=1157962 RepID=A0A250X9F3_9CHLO|nr:hypothetical protein CEUSTIGMA_g7128.t1 [Chlamydomonas eustigma]|eukprot:GAX79687.1 hypothetical protein CEUSTIGMA_g7128.t1 [Chlamydomonas eustigma]